MWPIVAFESVGPLRFGASRGEIRALLGAFTTFEKAREERLTDDFVEAGVHAYYDAGDRLEMVELFPPTCPLLGDVALLGRPIELVIAELKQAGNSVRIVELGFHMLEHHGVVLIEEEDEVYGVSVLSKVEQWDAALAVPHERAPAVLHVRLGEQDASGYPPFAAEELPAHGLGGHLYRLDGVPVFAFGLARGDVVRIRHFGADATPWVDELVEASGHCTVRVIALGERSIVEPMQLCESLGCETFATTVERMIAVDVPPGADLAELERLLDAGAKEGRWDYDVGVRSVAHTSDLPDLADHHPTSVWILRSEVVTRRARRQIGDVVQIQLPGGGYAYGRVLCDAAIARYRDIVERLESRAPEAGARVPSPERS